MMNIFQYGTLNDIVSLVIDYRGKTPKKLGSNWSDTGYRALSAKNIKTGQIVQPETIRFVDKSLYSKWMKDEIQRGDILITSEAPFGQLLFWDSDEKIVLGQRIFGLRTKDAFCSKYVYYYMRTSNFQAELSNRATGTTVTGLRQPELLKCEIYYPNKKCQQQIASILSALDDKIELNNKINKNLEEQIHTIFNEHFGQNDYSSEEDTDLGNVCSCLLGGTPSRNRADFWGGTVPWINSGEVNNFRIIHPSEYISELGLKSSATKLLPAKTTVLAITGATLGQISLLEIETCANQSVVGVVPNERLPYEFIYPFIYANIQTLLSHQTGGAQQHINKQNVEQLKLKLPTKNAIFVYQNIVQPMFDKIAENMFESAHLAAIRDTLLPRLMSGEIDVSKVDIDKIISNKE